jgi:hypothetical protein
MCIVADEDPPPVGLDPVEDCGRGRRRGRRSLLAEAFKDSLGESFDGADELAEKVSAAISSTDVPRRQGALK